MFKSDETTEDQFDEDDIDDYDTDSLGQRYFRKVEEVLEKDDSFLDKFSHFLQVLLAICVVAMLCLIAWVYSYIAIT